MKMLPCDEFNDTVIVRAPRVLTARRLPQLEHTIHSLIDRMPVLIVLDCTLINYIDAAVIAFLLRCNNRLKERNIKFVISNPGRDMKHKLEILSVTKCLTILTDTASTERYGARPGSSLTFQG